MGNKLNLLSNIIKFGFIAIGIIACALIITGPNAEAKVDEIEAFRDGGALGLAINFTLFIIGLGIAVILIFFNWQLITNTKKTVLSILGIVIAFLIYLIIWAMGTADTNETLQLAESVQVEESTIQSTSAGIYTVLICIFVGFATWTLGFWMKLFRAVKK